LNATATWGSHERLALAGVLVLACVARIVFFTGFFGSDEVTYLDSAARLLAGDWTPPEYIGAIRYGINVPMALTLAVFGRSEFAANLWAFACSAGEVALIFLFARATLGLRVAALAAGVLALLPLHVHYAGRLMADAPLAFFITSSFVLLWFAEQRRSVPLYLAAGAAAGMVFWIKEVVTVYWLAFAIFPLLWRTWRWEWLLAAGAALGVVIANMVLMFFIADDAFHVLNSIGAATTRIAGLGGSIASGPLYYVKYLFLDVRHTWLLGPLAAGGVVVWLLRRGRGQSTREGALAAQGSRAAVVDPALAYVVAWALGLFAIFTFFPVSLSPPRLIMKQTNYMLIFAAPLSLLAGYALAAIRAPVKFAVATAAVVGGSLVLGALEQQAIRNFTANTRATLEFVGKQTDADVYVMSQAIRGAIYYSFFSGHPEDRARARYVGDLVDKSAAPMQTVSTQARPVVAIVDHETLGWSDERLRTAADVPSCWVKVGRLDPRGTGIGHSVVQLIHWFGEKAPGPLGRAMTAVTSPLREPRRAEVFSVPAACRQ
jgi:Dolichyl-phosphate-mannose-protein mannosyltransferase